MSHTNVSYHLKFDSWGIILRCTKDRHHLSPGVGGVVGFWYCHDKVYLILPWSFVIYFLIPPLPPPPHWQLILPRLCWRRLITSPFPHENHVISLKIICSPILSSDKKRLVFLFFFSFCWILEWGSFTSVMYRVGGERRARPCSHNNQRKGKSFPGLFF